MKQIVLLMVFLTTSAYAVNHSELEFESSSLTSGLDSWRDVNSRHYLFSDTDHAFMFELDYKNHFNQAAAVVGVNYSHTYNPDWYQDFSVTFGSNKTIVPGIVLFSEIHRKFLEDKSLVLGLGLGYVKNQDPYTDTFGILDVSYYFVKYFSVQVAVRPNQSQPGAITLLRYFGVVSFMYEKTWEAFVRLETGQEGYTVIAANNFKNQFHSASEAFQVRYWMNETWGVSIGGDFYQSPFYNRNTAQLGLLINY